MGRYAIHQLDHNAESLYAVARKLGFSVVVIQQPVDALFGLYDQTCAVEIKTAKGRYEPGQAKFLTTFKGLTRTIRTTSDVFALYRELRDRHDRLFPDCPMTAVGPCQV